ncbi:glucose-6-phosphate 1-dehydrogenase [Rhodovulum imhoffii]|uniref:Glucose-6-phosphate 1-dehydrogenase n=1 Tax=Rhodovulum imhoffii TaxID=365340 RepID=A0A2T5BTF3_9RHOB|nr:glucose-6-phosphate dehydrogenase [Rhodovulum imhoffii]MBK5934334.1 glucose-6-phosphate dehydrogenase [Rhodovulum imhoffii]PTN02715.1 glucose-6-phosphate 1-dehydrogenase [Rhodovulum imhoffii]
METYVQPVGPFDLVVFGATGDLAQRKVLPALYRRFRAGQISESAQIIGAARAQMDAPAFRAQVAGGIAAHVPADQQDADSLARFLGRVFFCPIDASSDRGWKALVTRIRPAVGHVYYFSVGPELFGDLARQLYAHGIADPACRIVVEKPFGHDLASARQLNATLARHFEERQIFRIDHYLGKETVQNLMAVRFGNMLFEPLWKAQYVDHIQITVAESGGVAGRGDYYDRAGAMRDMVQNHMMQLLCLIAMEPPHCFDADALRDEKLKVIRALEPVQPGDIVRGQYTAGERPGYAEDAAVGNSDTESFIALKVKISNWRWKGTPFYLRTGKRLKARSSEVAITFRDPPHSIFGKQPGQRSNVLVIRLQPNEGIKLKVTVKEPGPGGMRLVEVPLDMSFARALGSAHVLPDAYERLIMDLLRGDQTLFMRGDEVEAAWAWTDPVIAAWQDGPAPDLYAPGSAGPEAAMELMRRDRRRWREIKP